jgi:hypothetical protein
MISLGERAGLRDLCAMRLALILVIALAVPNPVVIAQDQVVPVPIPPVSTSIASLSPKVHSPLNYFARSLLIPGWGQASLDRKLTGGLFLAFEGIAIGMALKAHSDLARLERTGSERLEDRRQERQDWFVLMGMNHLFSGLEAFVAANLYDFPADLTIRALPNGQTGYGLRLPMPRQ